MRIKKVFLENIRSYKEAEVNFPDGSVLLSGDIGSGKSSILLAIEFALFGLQKGSLTGSSLLRNGAENGKVIVNFNIDENEIIIERGLKKGTKGISQEYGSITINNEKKEISTQELRNNVLKMLNYPQEFMTKKPELYRYTVYTPQEEMKQILLENVDARLNTLRRIFAIDKYKRVSENVSLFLARLRESIRNKEGLISDLDSKKEAVIQKKTEKEKIENSLKEMMPVLEKVTAKVSERKKEMNEIDNDAKEAEKLKRDLAVTSVNLNTKVEQHDETKNRIKKLEDGIKIIFKDSVKNVKESIKEISREISVKNTLLKRIASESIEINKERSSIDTKKESLERVRKSILNLDNCPTCKQKVSAEHKKNFVEKITSESRSLNERLEFIVKKIKELSNMQERGEKDLRALQEKEKELGKADLAIADLERKKQEFELLKKEIVQYEKKQAEIKSKLEQFRGINEKFSEIKKKVDDALKEQKEIEIERAKINEQLKSSSSIIKELESEIAKKENIKLVVEKCSKIKDWLNEHFIPLVALIEKNVMLNLHYEFNMLFEKWFNMLVSSDGMKARVDENFTPVIEQQEYDIDYAFLSGGERTAAALAYRLALNQVINSMMSHIKTRDLLILDEPTDGFSSEQLDKMKDVLTEINAKQLILVSHENKIENFVDNIIRFEKNGHISKIL